MRSPHPAPFLIVALFFSAAPANAGDWTFYRHDVSGTANAGEPLSAADAASLSLFRTYRNANDVGDYDSNPIVADGTLYWVGGDHLIHAVDLATFQDRWTKTIDTNGPFPACVGQTHADPVGAPAVIGSTVYVPGADGIVYALDTATGAEIWRTPVADVTKGDFLWSSIFPLQRSATAGWELYIGVSSIVDCTLVPGRLVKLDASGHVTGTWWADASKGPGGGIWTQQAYDARTGRLFATTGTIADGQTSTTQPWADAFVAIDPETMTTLDSFSPVPRDSFQQDFDFGASPTLYDSPDGSRHYIAAADKNGWVYALDRDNLAGGIVWQYRISGGGTSPDFGESTIVSAPFANGKLFVAGGHTVDGQPGAIAAVDAFTGAEQWIVHPGGFVLAGMTATDGVLFALVDTGMKGNGIVLALDQATGAELYRFTAGRMFGMPTWANGHLYVGDATGALFDLAPNPAGPQPDYDLVVSPLVSTQLADVPVTFDVTVRAKNGFDADASPVTLAVARLPRVSPASVSGSLSPLQKVDAHTWKSTLTVTSSARTAYDLVVVSSATSGLPARSGGGWVVVQDFTLSAAPLSVVQGLSGRTTVTVEGDNGFAGGVTFSASGLPAGASASFDPPAGTQGATLTVTTTAATPPGTYKVVVTGTHGAASRTVEVPLTVTQAADFQVSIDPPVQQVYAGASAVYTVSIAPVGGFSNGVAFAAANLPPGATATFSPGADAWTRTLTVTFPHDTAVGSWVFSVAVSGGNLTHSASASATVLAPSASPGSSGCTSAGTPGFAGTLLAFALFTARSRRRRSTTAR